jgi:uncharacterized radical SAM superfamily protein
MSEIDFNALNRTILVEKKVKNGIKAEELREKLDPEAIIVAMLDLVKEADRVKVEDIPKLQFKAQVYTTILKKCMPDLRSLEVKENDSKTATLIIDMKD